MDFLVHLLVAVGLHFLSIYVDDIVPVLTPAPAIERVEHVEPPELLACPEAVSGDDPGWLASRDGDRPSGSIPP